MRLRANTASLTQHIELLQLAVSAKEDVHEELVWVGRVGFRVGVTLMKFHDDGDSVRRRAVFDAKQGQ